MGIVNVTPDSFSDGGQFDSQSDAVRHALRLIEEGADILDIGGESTRPGADPVSAEEECERVLPVIEGIRSHNSTIPISIDTSKSVVAEHALHAGATMINDVSAARHDDRMLSVAATHGAPLILMHMQGDPRTMQVEPRYDNVVKDVASFLKSRVEAALQAGVSDVYVDPGIGFGKTLEHNLHLLRGLEEFSKIAPVVLGISRKRFLGEITGIESASERDEATALMHALLIPAKAAIVRVHAVRQLSMLRALHTTVHPLL